MTRKISLLGALLLGVLLGALGQSRAAARDTAGKEVKDADPLPSWNDGKVKRTILAFVKKVTDKSSPDYVPPAERIACFDNDGTLWTEHPVYFEFAFAIDRVREMAPKHPEWKEKQPFKAAIEGDLKALGDFGVKGLVEILSATHGGMTTEEFGDIVAHWLKTARHPRFKRPYTDLVYQPMLELLAYLRASGFKTFIVSGGGIEFMRGFADKVYGIPPEQIVGTSNKTKYEIRKGIPVLVRLFIFDFVDDGPDKPVGIFKFIGRRPIFTFGNSDGDKEMLEWTAAGKGASFMGIVHHTDAVREYAYDRDTHYGRLDKALDEGRKRDWSIVDMKADWKVIYPLLPRDLIGKWVVVGGPQDGATFDFQHDGVMTGKVNLMGKEGIINARTRVEGDKLYSTTKNPLTGKDDTSVLIIHTLTPSELVVEEERGTRIKMQRAP